MDEELFSVDELHHKASGFALYNPDNKPFSDLPVIYGFSNGGQTGFMQAVLLAEDGNVVGGHICSSEAFMPGDLGCLEGYRPDRHEGFRKKYPGGYRMEFVHSSRFNDHKPLNDLIKRLQDKIDSTKSKEGTS